MGTEEITLASIQWHALSYFPVLKNRMQGECYLCGLKSSTLSYERTPCLTLSKEPSICECYTWFLFSAWTTVAVGFPFQWYSCGEIIRVDVEQNATKDSKLETWSCGWGGQELLFSYVKSCIWELLQVNIITQGVKEKAKGYFWGTTDLEKKQLFS